MNGLFSLALRMGDNALILGQQNSAWCGHGPTLEEDIALANVALDLIGQARLWLTLAGQIENAGRGENDLAYFRDSNDFRCSHLVQHPNGDYGQSLMRQFLFDCWHLTRLEDLSTSQEASISEVAQKARVEVQYHYTRSADLVLRLANGTDESHAKMQTALNALWGGFGSLFEDDTTDAALEADGIATRPSALGDAALDRALETLSPSLEVPEHRFWRKGAIHGHHSENLGHILAQMQVLQRSYPGLSW